MTLTDKLSTIKGKYHKSMIENVMMVLTGLLTSKTTNLYKMKDDMAKIMDKKGLKSGSYYQRLIRFFNRYSSTRLFIDLLLWVINSLIKKADNFFWMQQNGKSVLLNYTF
ncbi:hypothetical protein [Emticicia agri]|uniref:Uncharacterized protein n=1 Tax=Emticicia agri TaxID=2492393 RepID=A0A4Q5LQS9_9BACT|nr:hypothetical protein [Emticicia agri]RYU90411.1 hypothetical protein EWM59_27435 [Emticicia agri]RYU90429.1 hypothetical protein EWM59_27330 [Emticicia agri]RYU91812.1 hypothetical protein EWM59_26655 [Emticicia agri]RYU93366.1 hypothetical protein EWM59_22575 [Emticicia agri]